MPDSQKDTSMQKKIKGAASLQMMAATETAPSGHLARLYFLERPMEIPIIPRRHSGDLLKNARKVLRRSITEPAADFFN